MRPPEANGMNLDVLSTLPNVLSTLPNLKILRSHFINVDDEKSAIFTFAPLVPYCTLPVPSLLFKVVNSNHVSTPVDKWPRKYAQHNVFASYPGSLLEREGSQDEPQEGETTLLVRKPNAIWLPVAVNLGGSYSINFTVPVSISDCT